MATLGAPRRKVSVCLCFGRPSGYEDGCGRVSESNGDGYEPSCLKFRFEKPVEGVVPFTDEPTHLWIDIVIVQLVTM